MLKWAVTAGIPLIHVQTADVMNAKPVIETILGYKVQTVDAKKIKTGDVGFDEGATVLVIGSETLKAFSDIKLYEAAITNNVKMIGLNLYKPSPEWFNAGTLPTPKELIESTLGSVLDKKKVEELSPALGGLTLREVGEVVRLTMARDMKVSHAGVLKTRKALFNGSKGISIVDTNTPIYWPQTDVLDFVSKNKEFFLSSPDPRLRPRGVLFKGMPGTGKSMGAKYIAAQWGVPLYRLDATVQSKWVGESEENFSQALKQIEHEEPCVLLIDEVEKMFSNTSSDSSGVTTRMLGQLLWWLQEHNARVFTVMTCNNVKIIPPELHREGRVDMSVQFEGLDKDTAIKFAEALIDTFAFQIKSIDPYALVGERLEQAFNSEIIWGDEAEPGKSPALAHAFVAKTVNDVMKAVYADKPGKEATEECQTNQKSKPSKPPVIKVA